MKKLIAVAAAAMLAGCGADVARTGAIGASIKKQEIEQGQKTMQQMQQKIGTAMQQVQERDASNDK